MSDECVGGSWETTPDVTTMASAAATATSAVDDDVEMQLDNCLLHSDPADEGRLQIVVDDPTVEELEQQQLERGDDSMDDAGVEQCPLSNLVIDHHDDAAATTCPNTSAHELPADLPSVSQVRLLLIISDQSIYTPEVRNSWNRLSRSPALRRLNWTAG